MQSTGKVRPLGSKGSNPLQVLYIQVGLLNGLLQIVASARPRTHPPVDRPYRHSQSHSVMSVVAAPPHSSFLSLWLYVLGYF